MKQQKNPEKSPKNQSQKKPIIKYDINIPEDRDPQPKDYDEIEY